MEVNVYDEDGFVDFRGHRTWYGIFNGSDSTKAPLLCLHGGPAIPHNYLLPLSGLAERGRTVIFYDQIGCGNSDRPDDATLWVPETFLDELDEVRKALDLDRCHLYGHSWGGLLLFPYLAAHPKGVVGAIVASAPPGIRVLMEEQLRLLDEMEPGAAEMAVKFTEERRLDDPDFIAMQQRFLGSHMTKVSPSPPELNDAFEKMGHQAYSVLWGNAGQFKVNGTMQDMEYEDELHKIDAPVLVLHGRDDYIPPSIGELLMSKIPRSRLAIMENSRHLAMFDETEAYLDVLEEFMTEAESRSS